MVIVFALLAALSNAVNEATQHIASTSAPRRSSGWRLVLFLFRSPLWLFGWVALIAAFVFQALALNNGLISVVQPLLATELVFMLVLRRFWIHQSIRLITWGAAAVTCVGLTVFIAAGSREAASRPRLVSTGSRPGWPAAPLPRSWRLGAVGIPEPARRPVWFGLCGHVGAGGDVHQGHHGHADPVRRGRDVHPLAHYAWPWSGALFLEQAACTSGRCGPPSLSS